MHAASLLLSPTNPALKDPSLLKVPEGGKHQGALDYDDTVGFTEETALGVVCDCVNQLLEKTGFEHRLDREKFIEEFPGLTHPKILTRVREELGIHPEIEGWRDTDMAAFDQMATDKVIDAFRSGKLRGAPGIDALLQGLSEGGSQFCIVSSSSLLRLQACIEGLGHERFNIPLFSARRAPNGSLPDEHPKPSPDVYNLATGGNPDSWIAVEDSKSGMMSAANAHIIKRIGFVGCLKPEKQQGRACELFEAGALVVVRDHHEVLSVFKLFDSGQFGQVLKQFGPAAWGFDVKG